MLGKSSGRHQSQLKRGSASGPGERGPGREGAVTVRIGGFEDPAMRERSHWRKIVKEM